ncbi:GTP cyclohydrolase II [Candidatus Acetothermia bacterium]|nr:GTP cyclohydrolase II [Candidatus Acetothermia bacterium]MBI3642533.1 GTP cyclohydrolase II [Candidatus Acetothermia bacterium]
MPLQRPQIEEILKENETHQCLPAETCVKIVAIADLPSRFGHFQVIAFYNNLDDKEHAVFVKGDVVGKEDVPVRLHSECLTGDAVGSLRCDCRDQLEESLRYIGNLDNGLLLYLRQEGRGIGFINKIKAYQLQDFGYDTVEANEMLGFKADEREYKIAAHMLYSLKVKSIKLITNNPEKIKSLEQYGIKVAKRVPIVIEPNEFNRFYLETKRQKSGHLLDQKE